MIQRFTPSLSQSQKQMGDGTEALWSLLRGALGPSLYHSAQHCIRVAASALATKDSNETQALTADARWGKRDPGLLQTFETKRCSETSSEILLVTISSWNTTNTA